MSDVRLPGGSNWLVKGIRTNWITIVIFIVLLVALAIFVPAFYQPANLLNVARQSSIVGVVAIGMTFVILTGGIDLSVGSILALSGVAMAMLINQGMVPGVAILIALLVGVATGIVNGIVVAVLKIQPFIATLASMVAITGLALRLTNGGPQPFNNIGDVFNFLGSGNVFGLPGPFLVFLIVAVIGILVLRYLPFGRFLYAIGGSPEAARLTGVPTRRTLVMAYAVSGLTAALAGVMTASRLGVGAPTAGGLANLDAITAVVIGGTSLMGGTGGAAGTVFGALLLAVLSNLMNLIGISPFDQQIVKGVVIVLAVLLAMQATRKRISDRRGKLGRSGSAGDSPSQ
ncbi:MAG: ABC transporter permease [Microbacteriaceae bacterium]|jgi:ribose transport system permease protein|nr:ABC transporter permease [Microbacteriaceae bacterium]HOW00156.1 ABC transporter permease [Rhodoglobus sp.]HPU04210.1 ABC transporter permease [Rhodoglobus sp.]HQA23648.1 ABC transporter permease [Rhodoglobus sp.]